MFGSFNNWNIVQLSHKATSSEERDKNYLFLLDNISENISELVHIWEIWNHKYTRYNYNGILFDYVCFKSLKNTRINNHVMEKSVQLEN